MAGHAPEGVASAEEPPSFPLAATNGRPLETPPDRREPAPGATGRWWFPSRPRRGFVGVQIAWLGFILLTAAQGVLEGSLAVGDVLIGVPLLWLMGAVLITAATLGYRRIQHRAGGRADAAPVAGPSGTTGAATRPAEAARREVANGRVAAPAPPAGEPAPPAGGPPPQPRQPASRPTASEPRQLWAAVVEQRTLVVLWFALSALAMLLAAVLTDWPVSASLSGDQARLAISLAILLLAVIHLLAERLSGAGGRELSSPATFLRRPGPYAVFAGVAFPVLFFGSVVVLIPVVLVNVLLGGPAYLGERAEYVTTMYAWYGTWFAVGVLCGRWWAFVDGVILFPAAGLVVVLAGGEAESVMWAVDWPLAISALTAAGALTRFASTAGRPRAVVLPVGIAAGIVLLLAAVALAAPYMVG